MNLGDVADSVRDFGENVVIEGVAAYEVAEIGERRQLLLDRGFEIKNIVGVQRAKDVCDVDFDTIESVTYILPINKKRTDAFPKTTDDESAFLVIPPRSKWDQLCWDNKLLDEWR